MRSDFFQNTPLMKNTSNLFKGFLSAAGVLVYVCVVGLLLFYAEDIFGKASPSFVIPMFMMLLFVVSALITGLLVLGMPIHLYLSGSKKEAFKLLFITLVWLAFFLILVALVLILR